MKFIPIREFRNNPGRMLKSLRKEREVILTSRGKPVAVLSPVDEATFERDLGRHRSGSIAEAGVPYAPEDPDVLRAWVDLAERRLDDFRSGRARGIPVEKALAQVRSDLRKLK
jgi:prevent-host-death family protein